MNPAHLNHVTAFTNILSVIIMGVSPW
jgi:hypothetical protein